MDKEYLWIPHETTRASVWATPPMLFWCFVKSDAGRTGAGGAGGGFMVSSGQDVRSWLVQVWLRFSIFCKPIQTDMQRQICFQAASKKLNYLEVSRSMLIKKLFLASSRSGSWHMESNATDSVKLGLLFQYTPPGPRSAYLTSGLLSSSKQTSWNHGSS